MSASLSFNVPSRMHAGLRPSSHHVVHPSPPQAGLSDRARDLDHLLLSVAVSDQGAFRSLYLLTKSPLYAAVQRRVWQAAEAEDVLQETYVRIWRHAGKFNPRMGLAMTWMSAIAHNSSIDHLRRRSNEPCAHAVAASDDDEDGADHGLMAEADWAPCRRLEQAQDRRHLEHALSRLSAAQRQVLQMSARDGMSHSEIAEHLNAPLGSVKSWARRGIEALRDHGVGGYHAGIAG